jgi:hypothetical protein
VDFQLDIWITNSIDVDFLAKEMLITFCPDANDNVKRVKMHRQPDFLLF